MAQIVDISFPAVPNFPNGGMSYEQRYQNELNNILRLYLERLTAQLQALSGNTGGAYLKFPNGAFHQDGYTTLTTAIPNASSTANIVVASTAGFGEIIPGTILIGQELIRYTGKTATTFTGITRSVYGLSLIHI